MSKIDFSDYKVSANLGTQVNTLPTFTLDEGTLSYGSYYLSGSGYFSLNGFTQSMSMNVYGDFDWLDDSTERQRISSIYYNFGSELGSFSMTNLEGITGKTFMADPNSVIKSILRGDDVIIGSIYGDILYTLKGDDYIDAGAGNDSVDGGSGTDKVAFSGPSSSFKVTSNGSNVTVEDLRSGSPDGTDILTNIEEIQFTDRTISTEVALSELGSITSTSESSVIDLVTGIDDVSGVIFRLYNAAFARLPDSGGLSNWINANESGGFSYEQTADEFVNSQESINRYGSNQGDTDYITTVYNNVLDRDPDSAGLSHYESLLGSGEMSRAEMMFAFSESPENRILFTEVTGIS